MNERIDPVPERGNVAESDKDALKKSEARLKEAQKLAHVGDWEWDTSTNKVYWSDEVFRIYGFTPHEVAPDYQLVLDAMHPDSRSDFLHAVSDALTGQRSFEMDYAFFRKNGSVGILHTIGKVHRDAEGNPVRMVGTVQDITERKNAENELRESEERFRRLFEESPVSLWLEDLSGIEKLFAERGIKGGDAVRAYLDDYPEVVAECTGLINVIDVNQATLDLYHAKTKEDLMRNLNKVFTGDSLKIFKKAIIALFEGKKSFDEEAVNCKLTGEEMIVNIKWSMPPGFEKKSRVIVSITDLTERKRAEEGLFRMKQLESLGLVAAGIAHDFNNLLQGIFGNVSLAKMHLNPGEIPYTLLGEAESIYKSARELTGQLLTFSKGGSPVKTTLNIGDLIKDWTRFSLSGSHIAYFVDMPDNPCLVDADETQMRQVIQNLIINAKEAMPDGGTVSVRVDSVCFDDRSSFSGGGYFARISVADDGAGIPGENLKKVFDPYFSTKNIGNQKGMGLGLSICHSIIKKHGGHIEVESTVGKGTTFHVYLPLSERAKENRKTSGNDSSTITRRGKVLFMDDEQTVSDIARAYLEFRGFEVIVTREGRETTRAFREALDSNEPFDLVILDLTIPGGAGGIEVVRELQQIDPGVKAIVSSGYSDAPAINDCAAYGFQEALIKPYPIEQLEKVILKIAPAKRR